MPGLRKHPDFVYDFIRDNYQTMTDQALADTLHLDVKYVQRTRRRLGLLRSEYGQHDDRRKHIEPSAPLKRVVYREEIREGKKVVYRKVI